MHELRSSAPQLNQSDGRALPATPLLQLGLKEDAKRESQSVVVSWGRMSLQCCDSAGQAPTFVQAVCEGGLVDGSLTRVQSVQLRVMDERGRGAIEIGVDNGLSFKQGAIAVGNVRVRVGWLSSALLDCVSESCKAYKLLPPPEEEEKEEKKKADAPAPMRVTVSDARLFLGDVGQAAFVCVSDVTVEKHSVRRG